MQRYDKNRQQFPTAASIFLGLGVGGVCDGIGAVARHAVGFVRRSTS